MSDRVQGSRERSGATRGAACGGARVLTAAENANVGVVDGADKGRASRMVLVLTVAPWLTGWRRGPASPTRGREPDGPPVPPAAASRRIPGPPACPRPGPPRSTRGPRSRSPACRFVPAHERDLPRPAPVGADSCCPTTRPEDPHCGIAPDRRAVTATTTSPALPGPLAASAR
jgi:hypothetical protein